MYIAYITTALLMFYNHSFNNCFMFIIALNQNMEMLPGNMKAPLNNEKK